MDKNKLKQLLKKEEGPKLDFKADLKLDSDGDKKELAKDVVAIANSSGGRGYIIFGVEDKSKKILGIVLNAYKEEQIQQIIYNRIDPPVPIEFDIIKYEGKLLGVLSVFRSCHKPHQMIQNGAFYIRRGSTTDTARRGEIANLLQENGLLSYETVILKNAQLNELDFNSLRNYFEQIGVIIDKPNEVLLEAMGIIGKNNETPILHPTIGGLLIFGHNPEIYIPHSYIKIINGDEVKIFYGNIIKMLDDVSLYIEENIKEPLYPINAVKEAVANALVHRDYLDTSRGINIVFTKYSVEISNPGALLATDNIFKHFAEKNPRRRNPWLYQRLIMVDEKKRFLKSSSGIINIKKAFATFDEVKFLNIGSHNLFKVIFPLIPKKD